MKKLIALLLLLCLVACGTRTETPTEVPTATPTETPMETPTATLPATEAPSSVYTDWSKYTPYQPVQQLYSYHPGYAGEGSFVARDDYGALLPYIKYACLYGFGEHPIYGLVTEKGELVSAPVYTNVIFREGFLVLYRADLGGRQYLFTLAASDGSWVRELGEDFFLRAIGGLLLTAAADGSLTLWNTAGETVMRFDGSLFTPWLGENFCWDREAGLDFDWTDDKVGYYSGYYFDHEKLQHQKISLYLDFESGAVTDTPPEGYPAKIDYVTPPAAKAPVIEDCAYPMETREYIIGETYYYGYCRSGEADTGYYGLFDSEGVLLMKSDERLRFGRWFIVRAGLYSTEEDGCFCYRALADQSLVFRYPVWTNSD